jgi:chitodextrinase
VIFECTGDNCNGGINEWIGISSDTVTGLQANTEYTFKVKARNYDGIETEYSDTVTVHTLADVPTISGEAIDSNTIILNVNNITNLSEGSSGIIFECVGDNCSDGINEWVTVDGDTVTGLEPNTEYKFKAKARNYNGIETEYSDTISVYTFSEIPTISAIAASSSSITLIASNITDLGVGATAVFFECVGYNCNEGINEWISIDRGIVTGLQPNTEYSFKVKANNYNGIGTGFSDTISVYTLADVPGGLDVNSRTTTSINLYVKDYLNPKEITEYAILEENSNKYVDFSTGNLSDTISWGLEDGGINVTSLVSGAEYKFKVKSRNVNNVEGEYSSETLTIYTNLLTPTLTSAQGQSPSSIEWTFTDANTSEVGFKIYDSTNKLLKTCGGENITSCIEAGLESNTLYTRKMKSFNANAESAFSSTITGRTLASESSLSSIRSVNHDTVTISISANSKDKLQIFETTTATYLDTSLEILTSTDKTFDYTDFVTVDGLSPNTTYTFRIRSMNDSDVYTAWSSNVNVTTRAQTPSILNAQRGASSSEARVFFSNYDNPGTTEFVIQETGSGNYVDFANNTLSRNEIWGTFSEFGGVNGILIKGLADSKQYGFRVKARNSNKEESAFSTVSYIVTEARLINIPSTFKVSLVGEEYVDLTKEINSQTGEQKVRIKHDIYLIVDLLVSFEQDRNWENIIFETKPEESKAVAKVNKEHGVKGAFTMYIVKGDTNALRICPEATSLAEVYVGCPNSVELLGYFPQKIYIEDSVVIVSHAVIGGVEYWIADGLTGTGAQGFYSNQDENVNTESSIDKEVDGPIDSQKNKESFFWMYLAWIVVAVTISFACIMFIVSRKSHRKVRS